MKLIRERRRCHSLGGWVPGLFGVFALGLGSCLSPNAPLPEGVAIEASGEDCAATTYESFARAFFETYCLRCHSSQLVGDVARTDAPVGINFDQLETVREFAKRIRLRAGELGDMPPLLLPIPHPTEAERIRLIQWIDCGTPSETDPQRTEPRP